MATSSRGKVKVNKILVPTDFSEISIHALEYAALIARQENAEILLLHVIESYNENTLLEMRIDLTEIMEKGIEEKFNEIKSKNPNLKGVTIHSSVVPGKIHAEIDRAAAKNDIKLIVMGTHGVSGMTNIGKFIIGSNAYRTIQNSPCPIITLREEPWKKSFKDILLPLDSTKESMDKVEIAIRWAKFFKSTIHLLAVTAFWEELYVDVKKVNKKVKKIEKELEKAGLNYTAFVHRHQNPAESVLEYSRKVNADLVMIVTGQSFKMSELFFGSAARTIISESAIPVMSINIRNKGR